MVPMKRNHSDKQAPVLGKRLPQLREPLTVEGVGPGSEAIVIRLDDRLIVGGPPWSRSASRAPSGSTRFPPGAVRGPRCR